MKVIIPVAGIGSRLKPHTYTLPKPLLQIGGKTIIDYLLKPINDLKPEEVVFVIGYKGDMIRDHIRRNYRFKATFVQQDRLLGLGYALYIALKEIDNGPLLILLGDTIIEGDLRQFITAGDYTLGLRRVEDPHRFGIAEIHRGTIVSLEEKPKNPKGDLALIGLYYFVESEGLRRQLAELVDSGRKTRGEIQLTDALAAMIESGTRFKPFEVDKWYDCGKKETMLATNRHFLAKLPAPKKIEGSLLVPPVYIAPDANIENSVVGPNVSLGAGARIKNCILSDAIIGKDARLENLVLDNSIVGNNAVVKCDKKILNIGDSTQISGA